MTRRPSPAPLLLACLLLAACGPSEEGGNNQNGNDNGNQNADDRDGDGYTVAAGDCDDDDPLIHPFATEVADGEDNDCDGFVDDDYDGDGFGAADDCDDQDPLVHPAATEICADGVDNDCNGLTDSQEACTGNPGGCATGTQDVYVIDRDTKVLHRFDPSALSFTAVGTLECGGGATPGSMSVTRGGVGYVLFSDETLYQVSIETAACSATSYSDAATGFGAFGMGFSSDGGEAETLFVANAASLGVLDTGTWTISVRGAMSSQAEVTGTGDGELWAILPLEARMVRLDKSDAQELESHDLLGFPDPMNIDTFAFAHWGGSLWVFIRESGMGRTTDVYEFDDTFGFTCVLEDTGLVIVGAGVSTCAPVTVD